MAVKVLLVDDDALVRAGLRMMASAADDIAVVGEAGDGAAALTAVRAHRPDVVLMDIRMPEVDGITATTQLRAMPDPPQVIVLTTFHVDDYVLRALRRGASGFLVKDTPPATPCCRRPSPARCSRTSPTTTSSTGAARPAVAWTG